MRLAKNHPLQFLKGKKHEEQPREDIRFSWQTGGYHMEHSKLEDDEGVTDGNDHGYQVVGYNGSAPDWMDPFNDRAVDPSLVKERSLELMDHRGTFWEYSRDKYVPAGVTPVEAEAVPRGRLLLERIRKVEFSQLVRPLVLFLSIVIFMVVMRYFVLDVRTVSVVGASRISAEEIIRLSGIQKGMSILNLNEGNIARRIESNPYLCNVKLDNKGTHEVVIRVRERTGEAYARLRGVLYVVDGSGVILEEEVNAMPFKGDEEGQKRLAAITEGRVELLLGNVGRCTVGSPLQVNTATLYTMQEIFRELRAMSMDHYITEITLSDLGNISMATSDGYSVRFGDRSRVHAKLRVLALVADKLKASAKSGGTIDVEIPEYPTWIPETV